MLQSVLILLLISVTLAERMVRAQCGPITTQYRTSGQATFTISAQTGATVSISQFATVLDCASALVLGGGTVDMKGGTANIRGFYVQEAASPGGPMTSVARRAVVKHASGGVIPIARTAAIEVPSGATFTLPGRAFDVQATVSASATAFWKRPLGTDLVVTATGDGASVDVEFDVGTMVLEGGAQGVATLGGLSATGRNFAEARDGGHGTVFGTSVTAEAYRTGTLTISGDFNACFAFNDGVCDIRGDGARAVALRRGTVRLSDGTAGTVTVSRQGYAEVFDANNVDIRAGGTAIVGSGATATIASGDPVGQNVQIGSGATGIMARGARAYALAGAVMTAGPGVTATSVGSAPGSITIYEAQDATVSGLRRRAPVHAPRATCGPYMSDCPRLGGGNFQCVDTTSDIFNCGGCALRGSGVDCTTLDNGGDMACLKGICVVQIYA